MRRLSLYHALAVSGLLCAVTAQPQPADANLFKKAKKATKKVANDTSKTVSKEANKVGQEAEKAVEDIDDEAKKAQEAIQKNFNQGIKQAEAGYQQSVDFVNKTLTAAERAAYEAAAKVFYSDNAAFMNYAMQQAAVLYKNGDFDSRLDRMVTKSVNKQIDAQFRSDLQWLCEQFVGPFEDQKADLMLPMPKEWRLEDEAQLVQLARPGGDVLFAGSGSRPSKPKWLRSMTLTLAGGGGYIGGAEIAFGGVTDVYMKNGKVDARGLFQADGMLGAIKGGSIGLVVGFWPTPASEADGGSFGVMMAGAKKYGAMLEVGWSFVDKAKVHPVPGFAVGPILGAGVEAGFVGGWEQSFK